MRFPLFSSRYFLGTLAVSFSLLISGCGVGTPATQSTTGYSGAIEGIVHGGPNPIASGTVKLWATVNTTGYAAPAAQTPLATSTTLANGSFSFDPVNNPYTCPVGQFAYITVTGGQTGGSSVDANPNSVQMAAIGPCSSLGGAAGSDATQQGNTRIFISEISTVAAAYALSNFIYEDPAHLGDGAQLIYVGAPANNNVSAGSCTVTSGVTMGCTSAGLAHAFQNAANLVDAAHFDRTMPTGLPNSTLNGTTSSGNNSAAVLPAAVINTLGNVLTACVNTTGVTGTNNATSSDGSSCGKLFEYTSASASSTPTDTLMAMVNLAKHPLGYTNAYTSAIYNLAGTRVAFQPYLSSAPQKDWTLAIVYPGVSLGGTVTNFTAPYGLALDANDTLYVNDKTGTGASAYSIASNGTGNWIATSTTFANPKIVATDTLGQVWISNGTSGTGIWCLKNTGAACTGGNIAGATSVTGFGLAIDKRNNVWLGTTGTSGSVKGYSAANSYAAIAVTSAPATTQGAYTVAVDSNQNIWGGSGDLATTSGSTGAFWVVPNSVGSTTATPTYTATYVAGALSTAVATYNKLAIGIAFNSAGQAYLAGDGALSVFAPTYTNGKMSALGTVSAIVGTGSAPGQIEVDGAGTAWSGYTSSSTTATISATATTASTPAVAFSITPCQALPATPSICSTSTTGAGQSPNAFAIDSAGSLWVAYYNNAVAGGTVAQIIGTAAPTWPQLSLGAPGAMPH